MTVVFDYLVFNVQFVFAVSQQLIHYIIHFVVCQVFFLSFLKTFYLTENLFWRFSFSNFCIISYRLTFVKNFFNFFWKVFVLSNFFRASPPQLPATLTIISPLPRNVNTFFWNFSYFLNCLYNTRIVRTTLIFLAGSGQPPAGQELVLQKAVYQLAPA